MGVTSTARDEKRKRRETVRAAVREGMLTLVQERAFKDITIDELARAAGLSRSAFYFYFRDKHDLLMAVAEEVADELYREADVFWHGEGEPEQLVRRAIAGVAAVYARNARILGVVVEVATYDGEVRAIWRALIERFVEATAEQIAREQQAGRMLPFDSRGTAEVLVWGVERYCWIYLRDGERPVEDVVEALYSVWMAALYPDRR